jgi:flagellar FliL protein
MKKLIIPVALALVGLGGGVTAGILLKPTPEPAEPCDPETAECDPPPEDAAIHDLMIDFEYVRLDGQFIVPIMEGDRVRAMVVLSLTIEAEAGLESDITAIQPKIRDAFLQVLFNHAQSGGFSGPFTTGQPMRDLRGALRARAQELLGPKAKGVLVTDIVRQDL